MDKYLIEVYLPYTGKSYDLRIPSDITIADAINLISIALEKVTDGVYRSTKDSVLCDRENRQILDINKTADELNLKNGSQLILI